MLLCVTLTLVLTLLLNIEHNAHNIAKLYKNSNQRKRSVLFEFKSTNKRSSELSHL